MEPKVALQIRNTEPLEEMAAAMEESGFRYVAYAMGEEKLLLTEDWEDRIQEAGEIFSRHNLTCIQTHAPYYSLLISAEKREEAMELALLRAVKATKFLGAEICAVHPRSVILEGEPRESACHRERSFEENVIAFSPLVEECEKLDVLLGIENLMKYPHEYPFFYSYLAEDHCRLIDAMNSKHAVGIWDFGHANLCKEDHAQRILTLGGRIRGTHVHNNGGEQDEHYPPFMPPRDAYYVRRCVDWNKVMSALAATGFDGYLTLESVFPLEYPIKPYVRYLYDSVCELDRMLKK